MYASTNENSPKGAVSQRSMTVDASATKGEVVEEGFDEAGSGPGETESEDENPEATRQYWEVKRKKEGICKVCSVASTRA